MKLSPQLEKWDIFLEHIISLNVHLNDKRQRSIPFQSLFKAPQPKKSCATRLCVNVLTRALTPLPLHSTDRPTERAMARAEQSEREKEEENFLISSLRQMTCFRRHSRRRPAAASQNWASPPLPLSLPLSLSSPFPSLPPRPLLSAIFSCVLPPSFFKAPPPPPPPKGTCPNGRGGRRQSYVRRCWRRRRRRREAPQERSSETGLN